LGLSVRVFHHVGVDLHRDGQMCKSTQPR
jgi:hypothetical protein